MRDCVREEGRGELFMSTKVKPAFMSGRQNYEDNCQNLEGYLLPIIHDWIHLTEIFSRMMFLFILGHVSKNVLMLRMLLLWNNSQSPEIRVPLRKF